MSKPYAQEVDVVQIMQRIRDNVARVAVEVPVIRPSSSLVDAIETRVTVPRFSESAGSIEVKSAYVLSDYLQFHDEDFVRNAFRGLLRREPDAEGYTGCLNPLRTGEWAKVEVLGHLRYSDEGRVAAVRVRGLAFAFGLRKARRVPVLGRILGIVQYLFKLPEIARNGER